MGRAGIDAAVLSVSSPGIHFGDDQAARTLAREVNDAGAQIVRDHPGQFGLFAALPLPDTDGALAEIGYAFDTLGAAGVIVETNAHGVYLGDQRLEPVFAELVRRRATVMLHPTSPPCWQQTALGRPRPMIEFIFDTARAVTDLILAGTLIRHPAMSVIVPHGGGALPLLADRIKAFMFASPPHGAPEPDPVAQLHHLYYDLAGNAFPPPGSRTAQPGQPQPAAVRQRLLLHPSARHPDANRGHQRRPGAGRGRHLAVADHRQRPAAAAPPHASVDRLIGPRAP